MVTCASQLSPPNVDELRKALRDENPSARSCVVPWSSTASIPGANDESWTETLPSVQAGSDRLHLPHRDGGGARGGDRRAEHAQDEPDDAERRGRPERPVPVAGRDP